MDEVKSKGKSATTQSNAHYVDNAQFLAAIIEYKKSIHFADLIGEPRPRVPEYIGECFLRIATHLSYKVNFSAYMYREDMVSDGVENCLQYVNNFDPEKSRNPFSYFTQIIFYAFLRRIKKEKRQLYIKFVSMQNSRENADLFQMMGIGDGTKRAAFAETDFDKFMNEFIENYEEPKRKKTRKSSKAKPNLGPMLVDDDEE